MGKPAAASLLALAVLLAAPPLPAAEPPGPLAFLGFGRGSRDRSPLRDKDRELARARFSALDKEARLVFVTGGRGCDGCGPVGRLAEEFAAMSPLLSLETVHLGEDGGRAAELGVERVPAVALLDGGGRDTGIRYHGLPLGYEFEAFLDAVAAAAAGEADLSPETISALEGVTGPVTITVFVTRH